VIVMTKRSFNITLLLGICSACSGKLVVDDSAAGAGGAGGTGGAHAGGGAGIGSGGTGNTGAGVGGSAGAVPFECGDDAGPTIAISGEVYELQPGGGPMYVGWPRLEGVQVCVKECDIPCATTDALGTWKLSGIPAESWIVLLFSKAGYANWAVARTTGTEDGEDGTSRQALPSDADAAQVAAAAEFDWPLQDKTIISSGTTFFGQPVAGSTLSIAPSPLKGPAYFGEDWTPNPSLSETSANGMGLFLVAQGEYFLTANHAGSACAPSAGWPGPTLATMRVPTIPGYFMSQTWFICLP
jgi:hypothetical protein